MPAGPRRTAKPESEADAASTAAIRLLKDEHLAIASVLFGLRAAVRRIREGSTPDFRLLRALQDYIVRFPERCHHPKEERYLFATLAARCPQAEPLIAALDAEHAEGALLIAALGDALERYARAGDAAFDTFARDVESYAEFHWRHMTKEEDVLLPLARRHLTVGDWELVATAFRENDNPLAGIGPKEEAESLYRRILDLVPGT
jgi:hemerythrin-like domain-containing protein